MADASVRLARVTDLDALAAVQVAAWRASYANLLPADVLDGLDAVAFAAEWRQAVLDPPVGAYRVLVALAGPQLVGYAVTSPATDADLHGAAASTTGELGDLVVAPEAQRRGHGSRLLHAAVDHLTGDGFTAAVTWILATDEPRRAFLVSSGWGPDGAHRELDLDGSGSTIVRQVRLVTSFA